MPVLRIEGRLQRRNQITLPREIVEQLGMAPGDRLFFEMEEGNEGVVHLRPLRKSYAGIAAGVYGSEEDVAAYLEEERRSWGE